MPSASYDVPLPENEAREPAAPARPGRESLPETLLVANVLWFCRLRWAVVSIFLAFGLAACFPELLRVFGVRPQFYRWPFVTATILSLANIGFLAHIRALESRKVEDGRRATRNLWAQIVLDLIVLTVVVHHMGSIETHAAFAYLFHIALACIFFSRPRSFLVAAMAMALYALCVALEETGVVAPAGISASVLLRERLDSAPAMPWTVVAMVSAICFVVWYLVSHLSAMVRDRDSELAETNRRLLQAQEERARHMLRTTHELKAPFAAIHANAQLLLGGYCGAFSDKAEEVLGRIAKRCRRLANEIQEMLQLANLREVRDDSLRWERLDLADVIRWCCEQVSARAEQRGVAIESDLRSAPLFSVDDHMKMLFSNLLVNAVVYSRRGGTVRVACRPAPGGGPQATVEDHGIGVARDKLPHIFDEYFRTAEAVKHNNESSGLGLAIVRNVVEAHRIRMRIESDPGVGTKFALNFPGTSGRARVGPERREVGHGVHIGC